MPFSWNCMDYVSSTDRVGQMISSHTLNKFCCIRFLHLLDSFSKASEFLMSQGLEGTRTKTLILSSVLSFAHISRHMMIREIL